MSTVDVIVRTRQISKNQTIGNRRRQSGRAPFVAANTTRPDRYPSFRQWPSISRIFPVHRPKRGRVHERRIRWRANNNDITDYRPSRPGENPDGFLNTFLFTDGRRSAAVAPYYYDRRVVTVSPRSFLFYDRFASSVVPQTITRRYNRRVRGPLSYNTCARAHVCVHDDRFTRVVFSGAPPVKRINVVFFFAFRKTRSPTI